MINISTISFIFILKIISKNPLKKEFISNTFSSSYFRFINNLHYYTMYYTIFIEVYSNYLTHSYFSIIKKSFTNVKLLLNGERTGIRTPDTRLRRALLYPAELCTHIIEFIWSGKRDSNSRLQPWQGCALPLNYCRIIGGNNRTRTCDPLINSQLLYQLSHIPEY